MSTVLQRALAAALLVLAVGVVAGDVALANVKVINHVFTSRVIRAEDGGYYVQDVLVGFARGQASFQTLTQVVLEPGTYRFSVALHDPRGAVLDRIQFGPVQAQRGVGSYALEGTWRGLRLANAGVYELVLSLEGQPVARFYLVVN